MNKKLSVIRIQKYYPYKGVVRKEEFLLPHLAQLTVD